MDDSAAVSIPQELKDSPDLASALADFPKLGEYLRSLDEGGGLTAAALRRVWKYAVPTLLHPLTSHASIYSSFEMATVQKKLFDPLEDFLFDGKSYEVVAEELKAFDDPPIVCGRVFKSGEPTYTCRNCWMDRTCVLCVSCFQHSEHRNHRYKICASDGGGFCDCGDPEAWKSHPSCSLHSAPDAKQRDGSEILSKMPSDLISRVRFVIESCLDYCVEVLCRDGSNPVDLELTTSERQWTTPVKLDELSEKYTTLLYNDETHSYNAVMYTLTRAIDVTPKVAIDYATMVDQEGRCAIFVGNARECAAMKQRIETLSARDPLKTTVVHSYVLAHEMFCHRLLTWLLRIVRLSNGFKKIFADVVMERRVDGDMDKIVVRVMRHDAKLWKAARAAWHNLFIATMLMNFERKKQFAVVFADNYCPLLDEHVDDDQIHQSSIISFSVQLFTVPSVARHLIEEHGILSKLFTTFISGCDQGLPGSVTAAAQMAKNKRARVVFCDLNYLLSCPPTQWTQKLRCGFLYGFGRLVALLNQITGSHNMVRQVVNHVEFETDWETAIHLQYKLNPVLHSMIKWCGTDQVVFGKAFRMVADKRLMTHSTEEKKERVVAGHKADVNVYDVATQSASLHYPLPRLLSGLLQYLPNFDLTWDAPAIGGERLPFVEYIEHPLRVKVLQAQVQAGMWRRNGLSLMKQLMFYTNVRCRGEMHDRDLFIIQFAATQLPPEQYLITLLAKFGLHCWADSPRDNLVPSAEDDRVHQINAIIEEFLGFLINIVSERHTMSIGQVTEQDIARKEILQLLCMENLPHSTLSKFLPDDVTQDPDIEKIIKDVASFKQTPSVSKKGVYELKPECWDEFNLFFHHYSREDQSKAEDNYRKMARARGLEEFCFPPPLVPLSPSFKTLANVMQCDVMITVLRGLFERTHDLKCYIFTEAQLQKGLFLMGFALRQEEISLKPTAGQVDFQFCAKARQSGLYEAFSKLSNHDRLGSQRGLYNWVFSKFKQVELMRSKTGTADAKEAFVTFDNDKESAKALKRMRKEKANSMKNKIMAQMMVKQKRFIVENQTFYESCGPTVEEPKDEAMEEAYFANSQLVAVGPRQSTSPLHTKSYKCILCQETELLEPKGKALVLCAFVQQSTVLSKGARNKRGSITDKDYAVPGYEPAMLSSRLEVGPHVSSCGHVLHAECWRKQYEETVKKEGRRPARQRSSFDVDKHEFLCPLCQRLSNTILPLVAPLGKYAQLTGQRGPGSADLPPVSMATWDTAMTAASRLAMAKLDVKKLSPEAIRDEELMHREQDGGGRERSLRLYPGEGTGVLFLESNFFGEDDDDSDLDDENENLANVDEEDDYTPEEPEFDGDGEGEAAAAGENGPGDDAAVFSPPPSEPSGNDDGRGGGGGGVGEDEPMEQAAAALVAPEGGGQARSPRSRWGERAEAATTMDPERLTPAERDALLSLRRYFQLSPPDPFQTRSLGRAVDNTLANSLHFFGMNNYSVAYRKERSRASRGIPHGVWASAAFTVHAVEWELRDEHKPILGNFTVRQLDTLSPLVKLGGLMASDEKYLIRLVEMSRCMMDPLFLPHAATGLKRTSFLHVDAFSVMVSLIYGQRFYLDFLRILSLRRKTAAEQELWPQAFINVDFPVHVPLGDAMDLCAVRFAAVLHLAQLLVLHAGAAPPDAFEADDDWYVSSQAASRKASCAGRRPSAGESASAAGGGTGSGDGVPCDFGNLGRFVSVVAEACRRNGVPFRDDVMVDADFAAALENACRPFLRCCAMFAHFLTDVPPSAELTEVDGDTFKELASYVGLPKTLDELFASSVVGDEVYSGWIDRWMEYPGVKDLLEETKQLKLKPFAPLTLNRFVKLPGEFSELINRISTFRCPHDTDTRRYHTICLVCGQILCSPGYCCQVELDTKHLVGSATYHTRCCGAGVGVYLVVQNVQVLLLCGKNKGCNVTAPYLDEYGESDTGLRRGNPLTLHKERYLDLQRKWLSHGIPETASAAMDNSNHFLGTDWSQL